ncbi:MAG: imidazole glycerol phosphate synthase subunit HisF [Robiginitomaculum sp.]|nr:MAG: imidazole glycerol phosphate synthase subunit HisF [Robiginitomaculum sp.]
MKKLRLIARIDVKNEYAIKGIQLEGLRKVGDPNKLASKYYQSGIDEIIFMDAVAAYYDRNSLSDIIDRATKDIFVPITVGGGIRTIEDIRTALKAGADKVAINTQAIKRLEFVEEASKVFGSQCVVASITAKRVGDGTYLAYYDNGREETDRDVVGWAKTLQEGGAGEIMLTSIDMEGTRKGFDIDLVRMIKEAVSIPVIAGGGAGKNGHLSELVGQTGVDAVAVASMLHYDLASVGELKSHLGNRGFITR